MQDACGLSTQPLVVNVRNFGTTAVSNIPVVASITGATPTTLTATIAGPIPAGQTTTATIGTLNTFDGGSLALNIRTVLSNDTTPANDAFQGTLSISPGRVPIATNPPRCPGSPAILMTAMEQGAQYAWFDQATGGMPLGTGMAFTTPPLSANTNFWVQRLNNLATVGLQSNAGWAGGALDPNICNTNGAYGLQFNVSRPVTLTSVTIYPTGPGNIVIRLLSGVDATCAGTTVLRTATAVSPGAGALTVTLNFPLAIGTGYILDAYGTVPTLFRSNAFTSQGYPLNSSDGSVSITGQTFNFTNQYYYWFFDWRLGSEGCDDERTLVPVALSSSACLADLDFEASGPPTTFRGGTVTIDSTIDNQGPDLATDVTFTATAPAGLVFQSNTGACTTALPCALGDQRPGPAQAISTTWSVPTNYSGTSSLAFTLAASTSETDPDLVNNAQTVNVLLVSPVDLSVSINATATAPGGERFTYDIVVQNAGPGIAVNTNLSIPIDPLFSSATTSGCLNDPGGTPACRLGDIAPNTSRTIRVSVNSGPTTTGLAALEASVTSLSPETDISNDRAQSQVDLQLFTDLELTAQVAPSPIVPGGNPVVFALDIRNGGPSASTGAVVTSTIPMALTGITTSGCDEDPRGVPTCTLSAVQPSGTVSSITIQGELGADQTGMGAASFSVNAANRDNDPTNNARDFVLNFEPQADLAMSILPPLTDIISGQPIQIRVRPLNLGPSLAQNLQVSTTLPAGLLGARTEGCAEDPNGIPVCTVGDLRPNQNADNIILTATVSPSTVGEFTTVFQIQGATNDVLTDNNTTEVTLTAVERSEIRPTLSASSPSVVSNREIDFTLTIEAGPSDARGVFATFTVPDQLTIVSGQGCLNDVTVNPRCRIGVASASTPTQVVVTARADQVIQTVSGEVSVEIETTTEGNDTADDQASLTVEILPPTDIDLWMEASVNPTRAMPGDEVAFLVTVRNRGPANAQDVVLNVSLPDGTTLTTAEGCEEGSMATPTCTVGNVLANSGTQARFEVELGGMAMGDLVFEAAVASATGDEANPGDESAQAVVTLPIIEPDAGFPADTAPRRRPWKPTAAAAAPPAARPARRPHHC